MANWLTRAQAIASRLAPANDEAARRWQVCYPGIDPMEVIFAPEAKRADVAALYPGARIAPMLEIETGAE